MENESDQYPMRVELDNLEDTFEHTLLPTVHKILILQKEQVQLQVIDFLNPNNVASTGKTT